MGRLSNLFVFDGPPLTLTFYDASSRAVEHVILHTVITGVLHVCFKCSNDTSNTLFPTRTSLHPLPSIE